MDDVKSEITNTGRLVNLFPNDDGAMKRHEAFTNAVMVQMIPGEIDEETGEQKYMRVVSIMLRDAEMEEVLETEARKILEAGYLP